MADAVELKAGPRFALFVLQTGPFFGVVFENLVLPADRRGEEDFQKQKNIMTHFLC